jgi:hypothetical protein
LQCHARGIVPKCHICPHSAPFIMGCKIRKFWATKTKQNLANPMSFHCAKSLKAIEEFRQFKGVPEQLPT